MTTPPVVSPSASAPAFPAADELLEALPWGVLFLDAQYSIAHINQRAASWCGVAPAALLGQPLAEAPLPPPLGATLRQLLLDSPDAATTREVWLPQSQRWLSLRLGSAPAGQHWVFWEDVTARRQAEADRQRNSQLLLELEAVAHTGFYEADLASGRFHFSDGLYRLFGEAPQAFVPTLAVIDARSHPADAATVRQVLDEAVRTRQPYAYRRRIRRADGTWRTLEAHGEVRTDAAGNAVQLCGLVQDITERVQAEEALHASRALLRATIDSSLNMVQVFEAVRDEQGAVVDFAWVLNNAAAERYYGNVIGQRLGQLHSGAEAASLFATFRRVLETGVPDQREQHYAHGPASGWFYQSTVKLGDGIVATSLDVTERKAAEQEFRRNLRLLEQAEAVAGLGSWDYDLTTGIMCWSEGMYQLVRLPQGQPVGPGVYLRLVADADQPRAGQLVRQLTAGHNVEETLRLRVGEHVKTVHLKAVVLRDETGRPARVLGVGLDISELQRLEADNLRLRLGQQQALFEAVQAAQETERKRMAESLHNGIGQLLYAAKLHLDRLPTPSLGSTPTVVAARREAEQLLSEAIRQTRALSHELVPLVLEEFGLAAALEDISRKMSIAQLRLRSHVLLDPAAAPLPPPLQMALYRMAQELAQNIAKHARGATEASLELETTPGWVLLRAEDNGPGFGPVPASRPGLGLRTIRDRVALLGGQLESGSAASGGAYVRIRIPLPPSMLSS